MISKKQQRSLFISIKVILQIQHGREDAVVEKHLRLTGHLLPMLVDMPRGP